MKRIILIIILLSLYLGAYCGVGDSYYKNPDFQLPSIFNPNNFSMHHSVTFMSGVSSSGGGYYNNIYTNHLDFKLHKNLDFKLNLNFVNAGTMNFNHDYDISWNNDNASHIIPEFQLEWRPTENTSLSIRFEQSTGYNYWQRDFWGEDPFSDK